MTEAVPVEVLTAADAELAQARMAGAMVSGGLTAGDRVVFCLPSSGRLLCAVLGALRVGIVPVLVNATLLDAERDLLIADVQPALSVLDDETLDVLDAGSPIDLAPRPLARPMYFTSGTTGRAKGVWSGIWDERDAAAALADEADQWGFGPDDVHLVCSPMYHSVSIRFAGGTLLAGGTCVILPHFDARTAAQALAGTFGPIPTTTFLAPSALTRLLALDDNGPERFDRLRLMVHAGSPCPPALKRAAFEVVGPDVLWEFYGATEGQFTVCSPAEWIDHPGTVGRARRGRTLSVDDDGTVWCRPPAFSRFDYWGDEEKTAAAWRDGWFSVGDLGRLDAEGYMKTVAYRTRVIREWLMFLEDYPLILAPVSVKPPWPVNADLGGEAPVREIFWNDFRFTSAISVLGLPAAVTPVGLVGGHPVGVQIIGRRFREDLCLDAAAAIEARVGVLTRQLWAR